MNTIKVIHTPSQVPHMELDYIKGLDILRGNVILVVPEQVAFDAEKYLINQAGYEGLFHVRVYGFQKLLHELGYLVGIGPENLISEFGKMLVLMQLLKRLDAKLETYRASYRSKSLTELILSQLDALRSEEIGTEDLLRLSESVRTSQPTLAKKLYELSLIMNEYLHFFEGGKIDQIELARRLTEHFLSEEGGRLLDDYDLVVDFFTGMSSSELSLLTAMASKAENAVFRMLHAGSGVAARYAHKFLAQMEQAFRESGQSYQIERISYPPGQSEKNAQAFASLFDYENKRYPTRPNFEIVSAGSREEELAYIAQDILSHMRSGNYKWNEFALVTSNMEVYEYSVDKVFQSYQIPYFRDENVPIVSFDAVLFLISSLRAVAGNFGTKQVIDCLKFASSLSLDEEEGAARYAAASEIERYALSMNLGYDRWFRQESFQFFAEDLGEEERGAMLTFKDEILTALRELRDAFQEAPTVKEKSLCFKSYLDRFAFFEFLDEKLFRHAESEEEDEYGKYAAIKRGLEEVFVQIEAFSGETESDEESFVELFLSALSSYQAGISPPSGLKVLSGSIERSKFLGVKILYVAGANDGALPQAKFGAKSIFSSSELSYLDELSDYDFKTVSKFIDKEIFDLYEKIIYAWEKTVFTYPTTDEKKDELTESNWIKSLKKRFGIEEKYYEHGLRAIGESGRKQPFYEELFLQTSPRYFQNRGFDSEYSEEYSSFLQAENRLQGELLEHADEYVKKVARLREEDGLKSYRLSVSRLERQAACPYGFFVQYALKPVQNEYESVDYAMIGNVFHRALENFIKGYQSAEDKEDFSARSEAILKELFWESQQEEEVLKINAAFKKRFQYFEPSIKYIARSVLSQLQSTDACEMQTYTEKEFEHRFRNGDKELLIEGKIDRVDLLHFGGKDYLRVIDYKTGNKEFSEKDVREGTQLQLLTYLRALLEGEYKGAEAIGAFYHSVRESFSDLAEIGEAGASEAEILKQYRLSGRYLHNEDLIKAADRALAESGESLSTNLSLLKSGSLSKRSATLIDEERFQELLEVSDRNIWRLLDEIDSAKISVKNHDSRDYPCPYCGYNGILKLDKNRYREQFVDKKGREDASESEASE